MFYISFEKASRNRIFMFEFHINIIMPKKKSHIFHMFVCVCYFCINIKKEQAMNLNRTCMSSSYHHLLTEKKMCDKLINICVAQTNFLFNTL